MPEATKRRRIGNEIDAAMTASQLKALWVAHSTDQILGSVDYLAGCPRIDVVNITRADAELQLTLMFFLHFAGAL